MSSITMDPVSRFAWPGSHPTYHIHADGVEEVTVVRASSEHVNAHIECVPTGGGGCNGALTVDVGPKAGFD